MSMSSSRNPPKNPITGSIIMISYSTVYPALLFPLRFR